MCYTYYLLCTFYCGFIQNASPDVVKVLTGNKCDASAQRSVQAERGQKVRILSLQTDTARTRHVMHLQLVCL
jgi:hypothetical protein